MPNVRRTHVTRRVQGLEDIAVGALVRWGLGMPLVAGSCTIMPGAADIGVWPSWRELMTTYAACRREYLAAVRERFPDEVPGIETLYQAFRRGEDPSAVVIDRPDPRLGWAEHAA